MNDLPKVFVNPIDKDFNNSQESTIINESNREKIELDDILTKDKYSFNHIYSIILNSNEEIKDSIIQITDTKLLTIDNGWIAIKDIKSINEIKK